MEAKILKTHAQKTISRKPLRRVTPSFVPLWLRWQLRSHRALFSRLTFPPWSGSSCDVDGLVGWLKWLVWHRVGRPRSIPMQIKQNERGRCSIIHICLRNRDLSVNRQKTTTWKLTFTAWCLVWIGCISKYFRANRNKIRRTCTAKTFSRSDLCPMSLTICIIGSPDET